MHDPAFDTARQIIRKLRDSGHEAYLVGGSVRDLVQGIRPREFDIVTSALPGQIRALFPRTVPVGESFGVILIIENQRPFEVATFRRESAYEDGRRPSRVEFPTAAEEDVRRRDFTINGLLMDPETGQVIDHVDGLGDIERGVVRTIGPARERFSEDHLRMLRAVRFASNLGYEINPETLEAIRAGAPLIKRISAERIRDELTKILTRGGARRGFELLADTGLLREILPEVENLRGVDQPPRFHPEGDVWTHTLRMLEILSAENPAPDPRLAWGALLHDIGKPPARSEDERGIHFYSHTKKGQELARDILQRLRFSNAEIESIVSLIAEHMKFMNVMEMRPSRLKRFLRRPDFGLHLELHRLDCLASHGFLDSYEYARNKLAEMAGEELSPPPLIRGDDLIAMGFHPGPLFKEILQAVEDAQLNGELSTPAQARRYVAQRWKQ